jgi:hypothetical protein
MRSFYARIASIAGLAAALGLSAPVAAQLTVTDGGRTSTTCTSYTVSYSSATPSTPTITLSPSNCMSGDPPPPSGPYFRFAANNVTSSGEAAAATAGGAANLTYTVELVRNGNTDPLSVSVEACRAGTSCTALAGQDYYLEAGFSWAPPYVMTLQFAANETSKSFVIAAADDQVVDGSKVLTFTLINPSALAVVGSPGTHALALSDNEAAPTTAVNFTATAPAMFENTGGGGLGFIGVSRANGTGTASVTVQVQSSSTAVLGTNYALDTSQTPFTGTPASYTINFAAGETEKGIYVRVIDVAGYSGHKTAVFGLANLVNLVAGSATTSTLTIYDKDPPPSGGTEYGVNGAVIPIPTAAPGSAMCESYGNPGSPGGGGGPCGAYEIPVGNCSSGLNGSNAITKAWLFGLEDYTPTSPRNGNSIRAGWPRDQAMVYRFKTGTDAAFAADFAATGVRWLTIGYADQTNRGASAAAFVTISEQKCDFDYSKTLAVAGANANGCYKNMGSNDSILGKVYPTGTTAPANAYPYCTLKPDTVYYLNMRFEDVTTVNAQGKLSCPIGGGPVSGASNCGFAMTFN